MGEEFYLKFEKEKKKDLGKDFIVRRFKEHRREEKKRAYRRYCRAAEPPIVARSSPLYSHHRQSS